MSMLSSESVSRIQRHTSAGLFPLRRFASSVHYEVAGQRRSLALTADAQSGHLSVADNEDLSISCEVIEADGCVTLHQTLRARRAIRLLHVEPLKLKHGDGSELTAVFHNGWQSWSGSSALLVNQAEPRVVLGFLDEILSNPGIPAPKRKGNFTSTLCTAVASRSGEAVVLGYLDTADTFGGFTIENGPQGDSYITAVVPYEGIPIAADEQRVLPRVWLWWGKDANAGLELYSAHTGRAMRARVSKEPEVGWCSWYHYFTKIDEPIIRKNLQNAARLRERLPFSLFQIDDGWQPAVGDWLVPSEKFPSGMGAMAREIREAGFKPGLWLAPFVAYPDSQLYKNHPDWFVKNDAGAPRYGMYNPNWGLLNSARALDVTHPRVRSWLRYVFHTITHEWGYEFLKIDFLHAAALPGGRHDSTITGAAALRSGLEIIREAAGDSVHVLGCGLPLGPGIGLVDSNRVGMDVAPYWSNWLSRYVGRDYDMMSAKVATRNALTRSFMHRRLWQNDPDCILLRTEQTELTRDEILTVATTAALCAGNLLISDDLALLGEEQQLLAGRTIELHAQAKTMHTRAIDLMEGDFPRLLLCEGTDTSYLAVFNPTDKPEATRLSLLRHQVLAPHLTAQVSDYWTGQSYQVRDSTIDLGIVPAHAVRLLVLKR